MKGSYGSICAVDLSKGLDQSRGLGKTETAGKDSETNQRSNRWGAMKRCCQCGAACRSVDLQHFGYIDFGEERSPKSAGRTTG
jgi:hypothetical protein